jgi:manganese/zinc/iron transport system permease protein
VNPNLLYVLSGSILLGAAAGAVGVFGFLRKSSLVGETVAHSMLPGIGMAFLISGSKNPIVLLLGSVVSGALSLGFIRWIRKFSGPRPDAALAIALSGFYGIGIVLLTFIQNRGGADHSGLDQVLFGRAAAMLPEDIAVFGGLAALVLIAVVLGSRSMGLVAFNPDYALSIGWKVRRYEWMMSALSILAIASGIRAVGIVLMAALLVIPAATARYWTHRLDALIALSALMGALGGLFGTLWSNASSSLPTGPLTVLSLSALAMFSVVFAPKKGLLGRLFLQKRRERRSERENFIKWAGQWLEERPDTAVVQSVGFRAKHGLSRSAYYRNLRRSIAATWVYPSVAGFKLTETGLAEGRRINRLHRLWEVYLNRKAGVALDRVHESAEVIEHLLTPELERDILFELGLCENFAPRVEIHSGIPLQTPSNS